MLQKTLIIFFLLFFLPLHAQDSLCKERIVIVVFGNGMNTDYSDALNIVFELMDGKRGMGIAFTLAYNQNEVGLQQIKQVWLQKLISIDKSNGVHPRSKLQKVLRNYMERYRDTILANDKDLQQHVELYEDLLEKDVGVIVVAHSQGNFYANFAYDHLSNRYPGLGKRFKILSFGNPDSRVASGGDYFNHINDYIISNIPKTMTSNSKRVPSSPLTFNHGFLEDYFHQKQLRPIANEIIESHAEELRKTISDEVYNAPTIIDREECVAFMSSFEKPKMVQACNEVCSTKLVDMSDFHCPRLCELYCCSDLDYKKDSEFRTIEQAVEKGYKRIQKRKIIYDED